MRKSSIGRVGFFFLCGKLVSDTGWQWILGTGWWVLGSGYNWVLAVVVGEMLGDARRRCVQITTPVRRVGGGVFLGAGGNLSRIIAQIRKIRLYPRHTKLTKV